MRRSLLGALALSATATLAAGQGPSSLRDDAQGSADPQSPPVFESGAELVRLDLVVRDQKGRLIRDLRADEVEVLEDGQPVEMTSLRLVDADAREAPRVVPEAVDTTPTAASPVRPSVEVAPPPPPNVVVLFFDTLQGRAANAARRAAEEFVARSFPSNTWFGVFKATRVGLVTLQPFTESRRVLQPAIRMATRGADVRYDQTIDLSSDTRAESRPPGASSGGDAAASALAAVEDQMLHFERLLMREERGRTSLYPLLTIARSLRGVLGRKTLLHFSQGLDVTSDIDHLLLSAISEANRSNLAVYTFDARGLFQESPYARARSALEATLPAEALMGAADLAAMQRGGGGSGGVSRVEVLRMDSALDALRLNVQENLRELAEGTSGFLVANSNDLRPDLNLVSRDLRTY